MREQDILGTIDKAVAEARYGAYTLLDVNETFGERLEEKFREASKMIEGRRRAIARREEHGPASERRRSS